MSSFGTRIPSSSQSGGSPSLPPYQCVRFSHDTLKIQLEIVRIPARLWIFVAKYVPAPDAAMTLFRPLPILEATVCLVSTNREDIRSRFLVGEEGVAVWDAMMGC